MREFDMSRLCCRYTQLEPTPNWIDSFLLLLLNTATHSLPSMVAFFSIPCYFLNFLMSVIQENNFSLLTPAILGPVLHLSYSNDHFPLPIQNQLFLLLWLTSKDLLLSRPLLPHGEPSQFKSSPRVPEKWDKWVDRLEKRFGRQWKSQGFWPLMMIPRWTLPNKTYFDCFIRFWAPSCNDFIFLFGLMSEIISFVGLSVLGPDSPYFVDDSAAPISACPCLGYPSYRAVVKECGAKTGDSSATEHAMFLWVRMPLYIFPLFRQAIFRIPSTGLFPQYW